MSTVTFQEAAKAHRAAIAVKRPFGGHAPPISRTNRKVRSDEAWMTKDDQLTNIRLQHYLDYAPKIVLPVTLRSMKKNLSEVGKRQMDDEVKKLLDKSHPARCTSAQYLDRYGNPILFYFGRRLVHKDNKKVHCILDAGLALTHSQDPKVAFRLQYQKQSMEDIEKVVREDKGVKLVHDGLSVRILLHGDYRLC